MLLLACLMVAGYGLFTSSGTLAASPTSIVSALPHQPLATPIKVWKDCQEIAMCTGCKPVYRCRSCSYQRTCQGDRCGWGDVCVWGPYVKVLPRGARIFRR